jgi:DNA primase/DNA-binding transcriptional ArsR family regulator
LTAAAAPLLSRVVEHYHRTFCERADAQAYLAKRGLTDAELLKVFKVGYADGSLLKRVPKDGELRDQLADLGVITKEGRELMGGCVVVPIPDPITGEWTTLYGRGMRTSRHCYLSGPLRGVLAYQSARSSSEVVIAESVIDALSFHQAGISTAIPIYGTNGFTSDHLDLLKRERVTRVILALDGDAAGRKATAQLREKLTAAGLSVRVMPYPPNVKDPNELLVSCNGNAASVFAKCLDDAEPRPTSPAPTPATPAPAPAAIAAPSTSAPTTPRADDDGRAVTIERGGITYNARVHSELLGRLRVTVRASRGSRFHLDTIDLYAARSRSEFARRVVKALGAELETVESDLLAVLVDAEKIATKDEDATQAENGPAEMSDSDRADALALLKRPDLLDRIAADIDALGYVGEGINTRLLYLVAISRKLFDPLSAIVLSQSGAGKSGITEVIEKLTPAEDVVLVTRLTPQSLYYVAPGSLDHKLVIIEERYGSMEADYSVRVLQSRKKLSVLVPVKNPQTGVMESKQFLVEARAAFVEATTANDVNHENSTRCFELTMDESQEQTERIHTRQRLMRTERGLALRQQEEEIKRRHWNAQRLLEPLPVVIPYADRITFPSSWMRTRRDHARFLNLIEVSAFLHQYQRERKGGAAPGAIVATIADYATAYALAGEVLADTLSDLKAPLRRALARIRELSQEGDGTISRREIREALSLPDSTVRRWLADLVELEYVTVLDAGQRGAGKTARYRIDRGPERDVRLGLLSPDELAARLPAAGLR